MSDWVGQDGVDAPEELGVLDAVSISPNLVNNVHIMCNPIYVCAIHPI
jgi:hypothetical protein